MTSVEGLTTDLRANHQELSAATRALRAHAGRAVEVIAELMNDEDAGETNRLRAAIEILERAWGTAGDETTETNEPGLAEYLAKL